MKKKLLSLTLAASFLSSTTALAYPVPEREYWQNFTLLKINRSREENGQPLLGIDVELNKLAQSHAIDTAKNFDDTDSDTRRATYLEHISSNGDTLEDRVHTLQIGNAEALGENVGFRFRQPYSDPLANGENVHEALEESITFIHDSMMAEVPPDDGHRKAILGNYTHIGVGVEFHNASFIEANTLMFVVNFGRFTDGRTIRIPIVGDRPGSYAPSGRTTRESETASEYRQRKHNRFLQQKVVRGRTVEQTQQQRAQAPQQSWAERNAERIVARRNERLERLQGRVEERRLRRLQRRNY
jgi:uncharacterized protein YkwD